jgi:translocation and assembly module TamB
VEGAPLTGSGELRLTVPYRYSAELGLKDGDLAALEHLIPQFRPPIPLQGRFGLRAEARGTLSPLRLDASGTGTASALKLSDLQIRSLKFRWEGDTRRIQVLDLRADLYGGELTGGAQLPVQATAPGSVDLHFDGLDVGALVKAIPGLGLRLEGRADGKVAGKLSTARPGQERQFTASTDLESPGLRIQGIPTERLHGNIGYRKGIVDYRFDGESLGGRFHIDGRLPLAQPGPPAPRPEEQGRRTQEPPDRVLLAAGGPAGPEPEGRLRLEGAQLPHVWDVLGAGETLRPLRGSLDVDITFRHEGPDRLPVGSGRFVISRLRWQTTGLADSIQGNAILTARELRLRNLTGLVGGGILDGGIAFDLQAPGRGRFNLALDGAEAGRLLAPWPDLGSAVQGPLDLRVRGRLGREWNGAAEVVLARGTVFGAEVTGWRLPLDFVLVPSRGVGLVEARDGSAQLAQGRATLRASLRLGPSTRLEGQARFYNVDLRNLLRQAGELGQVGSGKLSGVLDFSGSDVRSLNDVGATLDATLADTQAFQFPVLAQLLPWIAPGQGSSATFRSGDVRARLAGGIIRIERLTLVGSLVRLIAEGTMTLEGRLGLEVTASAGPLRVDPNAIRLLGLRLPSVGPTPLTVLLRASSYLSTRVIRLRVTGTVRSPSIQVEPSSLLPEGVVRFFLTGGRP